MIPINEKMELNKFKRVKLPKVKNLAARYGERTTYFGSSPEDAKFMSTSRNKLEELQGVHNDLYRQYAEEQAAIARSKSTVEDSSPSSENV